MADFHPIMHAPGYYKTNFRALRLGEMVRWYGLKRGFRNYLKTRFMGFASGTWMPGLWTESACSREDLSEEFWLATKPHRKDFEQLGFTECRLSKAKSLNPVVRDAGAIFYLDSSRRYCGQLTFVRTYQRASGQEKNQIILAFTAVFESGRFTCTNAKKTFESPDDDEVIRLKSYDVNFIHQQFLQGLKHHKETPRQFLDLESLRRYFDAWQIKRFDERVRRGLFVPMTEQEVAAAQTKLMGGTGVIAPASPRGFGFRWALWVVIIGGIIVLHFVRNQISPRKPHGRPDTVEYQGQEFKMRKAYPTYEDYKDDPNNLDTNELDRIEQVMSSAKIPESFKNREEMIHFLLEDLRFPGYGAETGQHVQADDGSHQEVESVEIPQRYKNRVFVVRQSGEEFKLMDDFVYSTASNEITRIKLQTHTLQYYDADNRLIREKQP